jgi:hypothetical protein
MAGDFKVDGIFQNGSPALNLDAKVRWKDALGFDWGDTEGTTDAQGHVTLTGCPAFAQGQGTLSDGVHFAKFTATTDFWGNGSQKVTAYWNPGSALGSTASDALSSASKYLLVLGVLALIAFLAYYLLRRAGGGVVQYVVGGVKRVTGSLRKHSQEEY